MKPHRAPKNIIKEQSTDLSVEPITDKSNKETIGVSPIRLMSDMIFGAMINDLKIDLLDGWKED
jgi:hypothetical protein